MSHDEDDGYDAAPPTPELVRKPRRYEMHADERDGGAHRRAVTESERRRHAEMYASGLPVVLPERERETEPDTGPVATISQVELDAEDYQQINRLRRDSPDPYVLSYKQGQVIRQLRRELRAFAGEASSANQARADQLLELLNRPPDERTAELQRDMTALASALSRLERDFSPMRAVAKWALGVAATAAVAVGVFLYQRGFGEGSTAVRLETIERNVGQLWRAVYPDSKGHAP